MLKDLKIVPIPKKKIDKYFQGKWAHRCCSQNEDEQRLPLHLLRSTATSSSSAHLQREAVVLGQPVQLHRRVRLPTHALHLLVGRQEAARQ